MYLRLNSNNVALKVLPVELPAPTFPVHAITLKKRAMSPLAQVFVQRARETTKRMLKLG
jgi:DNA-binding transcriptional LysR family regulator